ncbi:hypothetical protein SAM23877_p071 (plasmid) [Streptomyces ambofaciens ATCC 23877]|uniref:Uncharacterized protein n=1 Tax=Streptomyces ambofaciens (strain ATCC 23877 / 3486 / DSM 40053 / JCM 4204 / NBRC 12836 / NRRL B-2516) TaxID=278992 RepID=A0A0K2B5U7_STRA7|nr:hypothetical protein [Streptomyces ambofaciens]AKZ60780.1 hypothetical protein SAM23877_p071 [Streptomyces ambofaciens ATCC 23877]
MTAPTPVRAAKPRITYPRPPLTRDHRALFREAAYQDGQPYADELLEDDEDEPLN